MEERTTPQFTENGKALKESIAVIEKVKINELEQGLLIRGRNVNNPILLILHGGPGAPHIGYTRQYQKELEKNFIVVNWDQRGSGMSYYKGMSEENMNLEQFISDSCEVVKYLLDKFSKKKLVLMGYSWGSILGMNLIKRYPQYFEMYFGMSQVVDTEKSTELIYKKIIRITKNNEKLREKVKNIDIFNPLEARTKLQQIAFELGGMHTDLNLAPKLIKLCGCLGEYNQQDLKILDECMAFSGKCLFNEIGKVKLMQQIASVEVPVCFLMGANDLVTSPETAQEYFQKIKAPKKEFIMFENSAHDIMFAENEKWQDTVLKIYKKMC